MSCRIVGSGDSVDGTSMPSLRRALPNDYPGTALDALRVAGQVLGIDVVAERPPSLGRPLDAEPGRRNLVGWPERLDCGAMAVLDDDANRLGPGAEQVGDLVAQHDGAAPAAAGRPACRRRSSGVDREGERLI